MADRKGVFTDTAEENIQYNVIAKFTSEAGYDIFQRTDEEEEPGQLYMGKNVTLTYDANGASGTAPEGGISVVKAERISYHYPFDATAASFRCSNDTLNAIWDLCHYSLEPCSFLGIWVDGNRERIPYEYDALIAQLCHYGSDAEYSIDRRTLEWLLEKPTWPTEWVLYAVEIAWNDYLWTGDGRALRANYELLKAHGLDALRQEVGLVSTKMGQSPEFLESIRRGTITDIVDWPHNGIEDDGFVYTDYNAVVNALYYRTLLRLKGIAGVLGEPGCGEDARRFALEAEVTRKAFEKAFFNDYVDLDSMDTEAIVDLMVTALGSDSRLSDYVESYKGQLVDSLREYLDKVNTPIYCQMFASDGTLLAEDHIDVTVIKNDDPLSNFLPNGTHITN